MATFDVSRGSAGNVPGHSRPGTAQLQGIVDFQKVNAGVGAAAADIMVTVQIPANTYVWGVFWQVTEASANAGTVNIGDNTTATQFFTAVPTNAIGKNFAVAGAKWYAAADTIRVAQTAALVVKTGVMKVVVAASNFEPEIFSRDK